MNSKFESLHAALLACDVEAVLTSEDGSLSDVSGTIPTNVHVDAGNVRQVGYTAWFLGRGRWLCLESEVLHPVPEGDPARLTALSQAIAHANTTGYWVTQFFSCENGVVARMATMMPADRSLEETVRTLVEDLVQAVDSCHFFFAIASLDGNVTHQLLDDSQHVTLLLRTALALYGYQSATAESPSSDDTDEDGEEPDEEDDDSDADEDADADEDEDEEEDEEDDEPDDDPLPPQSRKRLPWE